MAEPILIWGAGAIGGSIGAAWARAGVEVLLVDVVAEHVEACRAGSGLAIEGPVESYGVVVPAVTPGELSGRYSRIVLAVKAHHTAEAVSILHSYLADGGYVLSAQNGLNEIAIANALDTDSIADNFSAPQRFPVWRALGAEVMQAAAARGVTPVGFDGFDPQCFAPTASESAARSSVYALAAFNRTSAKTHSGIWRDLAVRKRRTEVDAQIAIIAELGAQAGVDTPAIRQLVTLIHDIENGRRAQSLETFNELAAICA